MTMHRDHTYNFRFQLLRQKTATAYDIAAVCCNSRVRENVLSSKRFTSKQGKIISLAFRIQGVIAKFWGVIFTPKNSLKRTLTFEWQTDPSRTATTSTSGILSVCAHTFPSSPKSACQ